MLWKQQVQTDRTIPNNKPDITIRDNEKETCVLIDVAISRDGNVIKKEAENESCFLLLIAVGSLLDAEGHAFLISLVRRPICISVFFA